MSSLGLTFLGTGTSTGVPVIGCDCAVCRSPDYRNKRLRPSVLVRSGDQNLLVDAGPDMRTQMLRAGVENLAVVLITHTHADHIFGLDDIRQFNFRQKHPMPIYGTRDVLDHLRRIFDYCFQETQKGGGKPQLDLIEIEPYQEFTAGSRNILPLTVLHGKLPVTAYKFGARLAYVTDVSEIPAAAWPHLYNLDVLILGTVRFDPHPTHLGLWQAVEIVQKLQPRRAYFTHLSHRFDHAAVSGQLPENIFLAYDGLNVEIHGDAS